MTYTNPFTNNQKHPQLIVTFKKWMHP